MLSLLSVQVPSIVKPRPVGPTKLIAVPAAVTPSGLAVVTLLLVRPPMKAERAPPEKSSLSASAVLWFGLRLASLVGSRPIGRTEAV